MMEVKARIGSSSTLLLCCALQQDELLAYRDCYNFQQKLGHFLKNKLVKIVLQNDQGKLCGKLETGKCLVIFNLLQPLIRLVPRGPKLVFCRERSERERGGRDIGENEWEARWLELIMQRSNEKSKNNNNNSSNSQVFGLQPQTIIVEVVIRLVSRELFAFEIVVPIGGYSGQTIPR